MSLIEDFVGNGVDFNACNEEGWNGLMFAVYHSEIEVVEYLLDKGTHFMPSRTSLGCATLNSLHAY